MAKSTSMPGGRYASITTYLVRRTNLYNDQQKVVGHTWAVCSCSGDFTSIQLLHQAPTHQEAQAWIAANLIAT